MPFVWIYRGRWPQLQRIQNLTEDDAERAVEEGWGQRLDGLDGTQVVPFEDVPHAAADTFYRTRMAGGSPSPPVRVQPPVGASQPMPPVGGLYGTREMVAEAPARHPPPPKVKKKGY